MPPVTLIYNGPVAEIEIRDNARDFNRFVTRGEPFDVPNDVAGRRAVEPTAGDDDTPADDGHAMGLLANPEFSVAGESDEEPDGPQFDPGEHNVHDVEAYLEALPDDEAGAAERLRVLDAETAGKNRSSIVG